MTKAIVKGSLDAVAKRENKTLAESFLTCDTLLLVDMSSSMSTKDAGNGISRYDAAERDVIRLQNKYEGRVALVCFSSTVEFCPTGNPIRLGGGTDLEKALKFIRPADDCGIKLIVISDGEPNEPDKTLETAKMFKSKIDCIFIGPENDVYGGRAFLEKLANVTGGEFVSSEKPGQLMAETERLMLGS
jgi:Mg-chelatase subunit ChlD